MSLKMMSTQLTTFIVEQSLPEKQSTRGQFCPWHHQDL
jgi:hypothetical protein